MKEFKDKVAVITGAASGIGLAIAKRCVQEKMKVVLADIEVTALARAKDQLQSDAGILSVPTDVSKARDVQTLVSKTLNTFGAVHLLFNNAGVGAGASVWESTLADWQWVLGVNLWGMIHGVHYFVPVMMKQPFESHIVNTASIAGLTTSFSSVPYTVSKHGIVSLSEALYRQLRQKQSNVSVSVICPGSVRTAIGNSERNRPKQLQNKAVAEEDPSQSGREAVMEQNKRMAESGMLPEKLADIVFDAIIAKQFYIIPELDIFRPHIQQRMDDIIEGRNPTI